MSYNRLNNYAKAYECLNFVLGLNNYTKLYHKSYTRLSQVLRSGLPSPAQVHWLMLYFKLRSENQSSADINATLLQIYGKDLTNTMYTFVNDPENFFGSIPFPDCPNCESCATNKFCCYTEWKKRIMTLNEKMKSFFPKQEQVEFLINPCGKNNNRG